MSDGSANITTDVIIIIIIIFIGAVVVVVVVVAQVLVLYIALNLYLKGVVSTGFVQLPYTMSN